MRPIKTTLPSGARYSFTPMRETKQARNKRTLNSRAYAATLQGAIEREHKRYQGKLVRPSYTGLWTG